MAAMERSPDPARIAGIRRPTIVNIPQAGYLRPLVSWDHAIILHDCIRFTRGGSTMDKLFALLGEGGHGDSPGG